jgi:integrase
MAKRTLTDRFVKTAPPPGGGLRQVDYWDAVTPGFGLRVTSEGVKTWSIIYRIDGKQVRQSLGRYDGVGLADARKKAAAIREQLAAGKDPRIEADRHRREEVQARADTVGAVIGQYLRHTGVTAEATAGRKKRRGRVLRDRTRNETQRIMERYVIPALGDRPMRDVSRRDLVKLIDDVADHNGGSMANSTLVRVRALFNWAVARDVINGSPCSGIKPPHQEAPRDRLLTDDELREIWNAASVMGGPYGAMVRFLLLTGTRRAEAANMTRDELDGDVWVIPAARQKSGIVHAVPLPTLAKEIIDSLPNTAWVFPAARGGRALKGFPHFKAELDRRLREARQQADPKAKPMPGWTLHDLRRAMRSGMSALRIDAEIAERCLAHVPERLRRTYDRYSYIEEKRHALAAWAQRVESIVNPKPPAPRVVPLFRKA